jgi:hypothetical protein
MPRPGLTAILAAVIAAATIAGCGDGSAGPRRSASQPASPRDGVAPAALPPGYQLAAELPTVVSHRLGAVGYRCEGPGRQLAVAGAGATEFIRFRDGSGRVRLAGDLNSGVARGRMLRSLRQSVQIILAVEPGTAVVEVHLDLARAPCEVTRMRLRVDSSWNLRPASAHARRLQRLGQLALKPHPVIGDGSSANSRR